MITVFTTFIIALIVILVLFQLSLFFLAGKPISRMKSYDIIESLPNYFINDLSPNLMLSAVKLPYIATVPGPKIFFKYYVSDVGLVWRWSYLSQAIEERYMELKNKPETAPDYKPPSTEFNSIFRRF